MGQSPSTLRPRSSKSAAAAAISPPEPPCSETPDAAVSDESTAGSDDDYTSNLPDECLASIFDSLSSGDRKRSSLVCRRWLRVEGQSRDRLSLNSKSELADFLPRLLLRFDSVTKLSLKCDRRSISIADDALILISLSCRNLAGLKLRSCRELTDNGISLFSQNCSTLQKFSCESCSFGPKGMNLFLQNCPLLEEFSLKRLRGSPGGGYAEPVNPGKAAASLKVICLKNLYNGQCFAPLIIGASNLKRLKLSRCTGDWDKVLEMASVRVNGLMEVHLEKLQVSDLGLLSVSNFANLEILHLVKTPRCTNVGLVSVAEKCRLLRKLRIDGWKTNRIGDDGIISVANHCANLQELVLIGVNPTCLSLDKLGANCPNLERLALCGSESVGDAEISSVAAKCVALKKLCIKSCPVSDNGMEAVARGCPNLVKIKVKKCRGVTNVGADWLKGRRGSLDLDLDNVEHEQLVDTSLDEQESRGGDFSSFNLRCRSRSFKTRLGSFSGTLRRWSCFGGGSRNNLGRN
ncbi:hypothetical protein ABFS82_03G039700 [Erythranthe guttata]